MTNETSAKALELFMEATLHSSGGHDLMEVPIFVLTKYFKMETALAKYDAWMQERKDFDGCPCDGCRTEKQGKEALSYDPLAL